MPNTRGVGTFSLVLLTIGTSSHLHFINNFLLPPSAVLQGSGLDFCPCGGCVGLLRGFYFPPTPRNRWVRLIGDGKSSTGTNAWETEFHSGALSFYLLATWSAEDCQWGKVLTNVVTDAGKNDGGQRGGGSRSNVCCVVWSVGHGCWPMENLEDGEIKAKLR